MSRTQRGVEPYEAAGFKDVVLVAENEVVTVVARYAPWTGVYMCKCLLDISTESIAADPECSPLSQPRPRG